MNDSSTEGGRSKLMPWWGYLLLAILFYSLLRYGPAAILGIPADSPFAAIAGKAAPIAAIGFLLLAANGLYANDTQPKKRDGDDDDWPANRST